MNYQIPRRDCVIIPGLYTTVGTRMVQFSDICGNAGLGGYGQSKGQNAFTGNWRTGKFSGTSQTTDEKTLCSELKLINLLTSRRNISAIKRRKILSMLYIYLAATDKYVFLFYLNFLLFLVRNTVPAQIERRCTNLGPGFFGAVIEPNMTVLIKNLAQKVDF